MIFNKNKYLIYITISILFFISCNDADLTDDIVKDSNTNIVHKNNIEDKILKKTPPSLEIEISNHYKK